MSPSDVFLRYSAALDRADLPAMAALIDEAFRLEGAGLDGIGKQAFLAAMRAQLDAFTGYSENPTDLRDEGDVAHFVAHVTGTHTGALALAGMPSIPATGRAIRLPPEPAWVRVQAGRLLVYHVLPVTGGGIDGILAQIGARQP
jgi:hypothetical protein